jgi:hypothetical protein
MNPIISEIASMLEDKINNPSSQTQINKNLTLDQVYEIQNFAKSFNELANSSAWSLKWR